MFFRPSAVLYAFQPISLSRRFLRAACFDAPIISHLLRLSIIFSNFSVFNQIRIPHLCISPIF